jgi:hypothetical protein
MERMVCTMPFFGSASPDAGAVGAAVHKPPRKNPRNRPRRITTKMVGSERVFIRRILATPLGTVISNCMTEGFSVHRY